MPHPASPKSVYRLAQHLKLSDLEDATLFFFYDKLLTADTAPVELFSDLVRDDIMWRTIVTSWLVQHWEEVKKSEAWKGAMRRVREGELPDGGAMADLLEQLGRTCAHNPPLRFSPRVVSSPSPGSLAQ
ncbi:hypothetical protein JCM9279_007715 [Rhodotorula babjevae]